MVIDSSIPQLTVPKKSARFDGPLELFAPAPWPSPGSRTRHCSASPGMAKAHEGAKAWRKNWWDPPEKARWMVYQNGKVMESPMNIMN